MKDDREIFLKDMTKDLLYFRNKASNKCTKMNLAFNLLRKSLGGYLRNRKTVDDMADVSRTLSRPEMNADNTNPTESKPNTTYTYSKQFSQCLHDNCPTCGGTGIRKDGLGACIHMISCKCPKCSPRM